MLVSLPGNRSGMSHRSAEQGRGFGMTWAVGISVALHLLLFVTSWLFPFRAATARPVAPEETTLRFSFAPTVTDREVQPRGEIPVPAAAASLSPSRQAGGAAASLAPPSAAAPQPAVEQPARQEIPGQEPIRDSDSAGEQSRPDELGSVARGQGAREPPGRFDVEGALRDFGRVLAEPRPPSSAQSREGLNIPDLPPLPATGFGFGDLEFESRDYDWSDYARQIYMAIWRAWHNRLYVTSDAFERWGFEHRTWWLRHQSRIRFTIERNGQVSGIVLETASGCFPLDESATDALREVILPQLPADFPRDRETIHARFIAEGDVRSMRRHLAELKRWGLF
jgi:hypothetical protein